MPKHLTKEEQALLVQCVHERRRLDKVIRERVLELDQLRKERSALSNTSLAEKFERPMKTIGDYAKSIPFEYL